MQKIVRKRNSFAPVFTLERTIIALPSSPLTTPLSAQKIQSQNEWATSILPNLWLGSYDDAVNIEKLKTNGVKYVLNISEECPVPVKDYVSNKITFHQIKIKDHSDADIKSHFEKTCEIIKNCLENNHGILVHCRMGISRSASIVIAFLMNFGFSIEKPEKKCYKDCFDFVKKKRHNISPNFGFCLMLREFGGDKEFEI